MGVSFSLATLFSSTSSESHDICTSLILSIVNDVYILSLLLNCHFFFASSTGIVPWLIYFSSNSFCSTPSLLYTVNNKFCQSTWECQSLLLFFAFMNRNQWHRKLRLCCFFLWWFCCTNHSHGMTMPISECKRACQVLHFCPQERHVVTVKKENTLHCELYEVIISVNKGKQTWCFNNEQFVNKSVCKQPTDYYIYLQRNWVIKTILMLAVDEIKEKLIL